MPDGLRRSAAQQQAQAVYMNVHNQCMQSCNATP
jgi:hypothetical protein